VSGSVEFLYPGGKPNFPRNYINGINVGSVVYGVAFSFNALVFFVAPFYSWSLGIRPNVFAPSSNVYSLDYVFDLDQCHFYINGVETFNQLNMYIGYVPGYRKTLIIIAGEFGLTLTNTAFWDMPIGPWPP
jgi:hypothetical protein